MATKKLDVYYHKQLVGTLAERPDKLIAFQYSADWQKNGFSLVDARKCISYHTIESHSTAGHPVDFNGWIFGCEECLDVCPWNKEVPSWEELKKNSGYLLNLSRREWADMGSDEFNVHFGDSGLKRAGLDKIKSNL